ncbi:MAG: regulatory protein GemA [Spirochaetaceae bacterium]|nr:regulatory protein GemA [Spirochaetaceae bacterium]
MRANLPESTATENTCRRYLNSLPRDMVTLYRQGTDRFNDLYLPYITGNKELYCSLDKVHKLKHELKLNDEEYRSVLQSVGFKSCSEIQDEHDANKVLNAFKSLAISSHQANTAFKQKLTGGGRGKITERQEYYLRGLWNLCMKNATCESSLEAFCKRISGVSCLAWLSQKDASDCITALKCIARQKGFNPDKPIKPIRQN